MPEAAVADAALVQKPPTDTPKYRRITQPQRQVMRDLYKLNTPQTEIAQVLGVSQSTVSKWLSELIDTTADATEYFRAHALPMAEKVVRKGRPSDLIKALQGVSVLTEERSAGLVVNVGGDAIINLGGTFATKPSTVSVDSHSVTDAPGSDNNRLC